MPRTRGGPHGTHHQTGRCAQNIAAGTGAPGGPSGKPGTGGLPPRVTGPAGTSPRRGITTSTQVVQGHQHGRGDRGAQQRDREQPGCYGGTQNLCSSQARPRSTAVNDGALRQAVRAGQRPCGPTTLGFPSKCRRGANPERTAQSRPAPDDTSHHGAARQTAQQGGTCRPRLLLRFRVDTEALAPRHAGTSRR